jgi:UDP-2-acetamido-2-deoxy-ribo-hexuluronate aminotransferase
MQFIDLHAQRARIGAPLKAAIDAVIESGAYVMGPPVFEFERQLAAFGEARYAISCANGTEALALPLMAWGLRPGHAVFCPSFTFVATAETIPWLGASPVFVDIEPDTYNICPISLRAAIEATMRAGKLQPFAVIGVDLFGQPANYKELRRICDEFGLKLIADSAQGFGCTLDGKHPVHWADVTTTSFFPAKPLGCYGDGGAILTDDAAMAEHIDSLRVHGKATASDKAGQSFAHDPKYLNIRIGMNSRLDTIQAAILIEKLSIFAEEIVARNAVADRYNQLLAPHVACVPHMIRGGVSVWAQYTIEHEDRDGLQAHLKEKGVPTAVYYPIPIHQQHVYSRFPVAPGGLPVTDAKAGRVISLPMHPYLDHATQDRIVEAVASFASVNA